ncbi:MAG: VWA domain-containing protein [Planctomycetes bacterium]|nr:VWA domain-containing protein [Planctomycetota bacterium]
MMLAAAANTSNVLASSALDWLANDTHVDGEGVQRSFAHTLAWPPWVTLLLLILLAFFVIRIYRSEPLSGRWLRLSLTTTRFTIFGLIVFMLYGWAERRHRTELPELVIAVDTSESMAMIDTYRNARVDRVVRKYFADDPSRLEQAKSLLAAEGRGWLAAMKRRYRVKLVSIGDTVREIPFDTSSEYANVAELQATDTTSRLGNAVRQIIDAQRGHSTAAIILLTDGVTTDGQTLSDIATYAKGKSVPLHIVGLGSEQPPRDIRLSDLLVDEIAFVGDVLNFKVQLSSLGLAGRQATVRLMQDEERTPLAEVTVEITDDTAPLTIRLPHRPQEEGDFNYVIEVDTFDDEPNQDNNRLSRRVSVRNTTIRVLLVQSTPSYEFRYLKSLLSRATKQGTTNEKAIELTTVLQEADLDYVTDDGAIIDAFPVQRDELFEYDVVIFGDADPAFFSRSVLGNLREFVEERGGGIVFIAGPNHFPKQYEATPLAELLPFDLATASFPSQEASVAESFRLRPTMLGLESPTFQIGDSPDESEASWSQLPELRWMLEIPDSNSTAMVLAEHPTRRSLGGRPLPLILMQFAGAGKVIFHATDESYLWARHRGSDQWYGRYWHQTIRYLSRSKLRADRQPIEITTDSQHYMMGDEVRLRVLFRDERLAPAEDSAVTVSLVSEQHQSRTTVLSRAATNRGLFETSLNDLAVGNYEAQLASPVISQQPSHRQFSVNSLMNERSRLEMDANDLEAAAATSRGRFYTIRNTSRLLKSLPPGEQVRIESSPPRPIWNSPWLAALFIALLVSEWILRKRAGLL